MERKEDSAEGLIFAELVKQWREELGQSIRTSLVALNYFPAEPVVDSLIDKVNKLNESLISCSHELTELEIKIIKTKLELVYNELKVLLLNYQLNHEQTLLLNKINIFIEHSLWEIAVPHLVHNLNQSSLVESDPEQDTKEKQSTIKLKLQKLAASTIKKIATKKTLKYFSARQKLDLLVKHTRDSDKEPLSQAIRLRESNERTKYDWAAYMAGTTTRDTPTLNLLDSSLHMLVFQNLARDNALTKLVSSSLNLAEESSKTIVNSLEKIVFDLQKVEGIDKKTSIALGFIIKYAQDIEVIDTDMSYSLRAIVEKAKDILNEKISGKNPGPLDIISLLESCKRFIQAYNKNNPSAQATTSICLNLINTAIAYQRSSGFWQTSFTLAPEIWSLTASTAHALSGVSLPSVVSTLTGYASPKLKAVAASVGLQASVPTEIPLSFEELFIIINNFPANQLSLNSFAAVKKAILDSYAREGIVLEDSHEERLSQSLVQFLDNEIRIAEVAQAQDIKALLINLVEEIPNEMLSSESTAAIIEKLSDFYNGSYLEIYITNLLNNPSEILHIIEKRRENEKEKSKKRATSSINSSIILHSLKDREARARATASFETLNTTSLQKILADDIELCRKIKLFNALSTIAANLLRMKKMALMHPSSDEAFSHLGIKSLQESDGIIEVIASILGVEHQEHFLNQTSINAARVDFIKNKPPYTTNYFNTTSGSKYTAAKELIIREIDKLGKEDSTDNSTILMQLTLVHDLVENLYFTNISEEVLRFITTYIAPNIILSTAASEEEIRKLLLNLSLEAAKLFVDAKIQSKAHMVLVSSESYLEKAKHFVQELGGVEAVDLSRATLLDGEALAAAETENEIAILLRNKQQLVEDLERETHEYSIALEQFVSLADKNATLGKDITYSSKEYQEYLKYIKEAQLKLSQILDTINALSEHIPNHKDLEGDEKLLSQGINVKFSSIPDYKTFSIIVIEDDTSSPDEMETESDEEYYYTEDSAELATEDEYSSSEDEEGHSSLEKLLILSGIRLHKILDEIADGNNIEVNQTKLKQERVIVHFLLNSLNNPSKKANDDFKRLLSVFSSERKIKRKSNINQDEKKFLNTLRDKIYSETPNAIRVNSLDSNKFKAKIKHRIKSINLTPNLTKQEKLFLRLLSDLTAQTFAITFTLSANKNNEKNEAYKKKLQIEILKGALLSVTPSSFSYVEYLKFHNQVANYSLEELEKKYDKFKDKEAEQPEYVIRFKEKIEEAGNIELMEQVKSEIKLGITSYITAFLAAVADLVSGRGFTYKKLIDKTLERKAGDIINDNPSQTKIRLATEKRRRSSITATSTFVFSDSEADGPAAKPSSSNAAKTHKKRIK